MNVVLKFLLAAVIFLIGFIVGFVAADLRAYKVCDKALDLANTYVNDLRSTLKEMRDKYEQIIGIQRYIEGYGNGVRSSKKKAKTTKSGEVKE